MDHKESITGKLKNYLNWPLAFGALWLVLVIFLFAFAGQKAGWIALAFFGVYLAAAIFLSVRRRPELMNEMVSFATQYGDIQKKLMQEFAVPYAILDPDGNFLYMNREFAELTGKDQNYSKNISEIFADVRQEELPLDEEKASFMVTSGDRIFKAELQRILVGDSGDGKILPDLGDLEYIITVTLLDETELKHLEDERDNNQLVFGLLTLDNYDEALEDVEDVRRSLFLALIERKINQHLHEVDGIVKKLGHDRYFFVMRKESLKILEENKFSMLEDVKKVNIGNEMSMTISMGIGLGAETCTQNAEAARMAMELALGRGGDQVVIKDGFKTRFYGGKTETAEKSTRVKARVKAQALKEILEGKGRVVIMGHKISDIDAIGAAIGIYECARTIGKPASIVADDVTENVIPVIEGFRKKKNYDENMFVDRKKAMEMMNADTALVIVDTNKASYVACKELLTMTNTIIVFDHHRQGVDRVENAVLSYIEPYASSASEMIAEMLPYFDESLRLKGGEADALYAGIVVDTNGFVTRTGVRTFEAAAYLRKCGADITRVRKLFREHSEDLRAKAKAIADAELYEDVYAISICPSEGLNQPPVVAAQAANELLNVQGIKASFVLTEYNDMIYISARAMDEVNVQLIMEQLGGGGHLNIAGAQLVDYSMNEAMDLLKTTIKQMGQDGDI